MAAARPEATPPEPPQPPRVPPPPSAGRRRRAEFETAPLAPAEGLSDIDRLAARAADADRAHATSHGGCCRR